MREHVQQRAHGAVGRRNSASKQGCATHHRTWLHPSDTGHTLSLTASYIYVSLSNVCHLYLDRTRYFQLTLTSTVAAYRYTVIFWHRTASRTPLSTDFIARCTSLRIMWNPNPVRACDSTRLNVRPPRSRRTCTQTIVYCYRKLNNTNCTILKIFSQAIRMI